MTKHSEREGIRAETSAALNRQSADQATKAAHPTQAEQAAQAERADASSSQPIEEHTDLPNVPFLELSEGRLQGVIASETQPGRIYASSISGNDHGLNCRSNDDRACGGLGERTACRHIEALIKQAVKEFGAARLAQYLVIEPISGQDLCAALHPTPAPSHADEVFNSFLHHMAYLDVPGVRAR